MRQKLSLFRRAFLGSIVHGAVCVCSVSAIGILYSARVIASEQHQPESKPRTESPTWVELIRRTQLSGTPSILVVTSNTVPASKSYVRSLLQSPMVLRLQSQIGVAELSVEDDREQARRLQINTYPTLVAFKRTKAGGLETAGIYRGSLTADMLNGWILGLGLSQSVVTTSAPTDSVVAASAGGATQLSAGRAPDDHVERTSYQQPPNPSPQQPICYPPSPPVKMAPPAPAPSAPREVYVPQRAPTKVIRKVVPQPRQVVTRRVRVVPREEVEVVEVPRRRAVRRVEEELPRSLLTQPREAEAEEEVEVREVEAPSPREVEEVVEVREVEAPAPREVIVREVEAPARREVVRVREVEVPAPRAAEAPGEIALIQPGLLERFVGRIGRGLAVRGNPRVAVETRQEVVTVAAAPRAAVVVASPRAAAPSKQPCYQGVCAVAPPAYSPQPEYAPQPTYAAPPYAPSPQSPNR